MAAMGYATAAGLPSPPVPVPLPPPRPPEQGPPFPAVVRPPAPPPPVPAPAPDPTGADRVCAALLGSGKVAARTVGPVQGEDGCGIAAPVEVAAVIAGPERRIAITPPVEVACGIAGAFADWIVVDLIPLFDKAGLPLAGLVGTSGYSCRGRNRVAGAKLSEHAFGDAIDIGGFAVAGHAAVGVHGGPAALLGEIKRTACARFATVLGPGSDGYHEEHMHVDLAPRRNGFKLCEWTLP